MPTFKFAPNVPATVDVKYIDIVPSDKGDPQVRFKGTIDGTEKMFAYLPGKLPANIATLIAAGVIANQVYPTEVSEPVEVKPLKRQFTMMKEQLAGDKYGTFKLLQAGPGSNVASAAVPAPASNGAAAAGATSAPVKSYSELYGKATDYILSTIVPKYDAKGLTPDAWAVRGMVADLFTAKLKES